MTTNHNDNAYPMVTVEVIEFGLTKREYFAAIALRGLISRGASSHHLTAASAVQFADALIDQLNLRGDADE